ncbi:MAG TPA: hypothetical protein VJV22_02110 [Acidobacteriaceae bacterium]|nr:hypothetical protein [Acidobacteriaceae bacterium]
MGQPSLDIPPAARKPERRLDSWKEIAGYVNRDVTTVQRWEKREGMPVHRHLHDKRGSVYALPEELDAWIESRRARAGEPESELPAEVTQPETRPARTVRTGLWVAIAAVACLCLAAGGWLGLRHRAATAVQPRIRSIAVLPLHNLSGDPAQDYLADGITEALIGRLAGIRELRVVSHTSVMRFRNPQLSSPEIARELNVDALVEGSVIRDGNRIRVTAQLIRGAADEHFWSQTYDREMRDALAMESDLAQSIADKVEVTITGEEHLRLTAAHPVAPEVYESYLKGRYVFQRGTRNAIEQSLLYFEDAIRRDPQFAPAYAALAQAWNTLGTVYAGVPPAEARPKAIAYAREALALDPDSVGAHLALGEVLQEEWHWAEAEAEYRRILDVNPNHAVAASDLAFWLVCQGRSDEAVTTIEHAQALDPAAVSGDQVSGVLVFAHRYSEAIRESRSSSALHPDDPYILTGLGFALIANNQAPDAIPVLEKAMALSHGSPFTSGILVRAYAHAGRRADALRLFDELKARRKKGYVPAAAFVNATLGLGGNEQAFYWLEEAYREQSNILQFVKVHPYFDPIRSDPRFADLVRRVGLE